MKRRLNKLIPTKSSLSDDEKKKIDELIDNLKNDLQNPNNFKINEEAERVVVIDMISEEGG